MSGALQFPVFKPAMRIIQNISNTNPAIVQATFSHNYYTGLLVRMYIPEGFGMNLVNKVVVPITVLSDTTFSIPIDTTDFTPFVIPVDFPFDLQSAQVVPVGELPSDNFVNATMNVLPY